MGNSVGTDGDACRFPLVSGGKYRIYNLNVNVYGVKYEQFS